MASTTTCLPPGQVDDQVRPQRRLVARDRRLLDEVAVADHAGELDHVAQLHLAPLPAGVGLAQRGDERAGLGPQPLAGLGQRLELRLEAPARLAPLLVEPQQLRVDAAELVAERRHQLLDRLLALVEVALGLGLGGRSCARASSASWAMLACSASALSALNEADSRSWASVIVASRSADTARSCSSSACARTSSRSSSPARAASRQASAAAGAAASEHDAGADEQTDQQPQRIHGPSRMARPLGRNESPSPEDIRCRIVAWLMIGFAAG